MLVCLLFCCCPFFFFKGAIFNLFHHPATRYASKFTWGFTVSILFSPAWKVKMVMSSQAETSACEALSPSAWFLIKAFTRIEAEIQK